MKLSKYEMGIMSKRLANKIEKMTPMEYEIFICSEISKIEQIEKQIEKNNKKIAKIADLPTKRNLTEANELLICGISSAGCLLMAAGVGLLIGQTENGISGGDVAFFSGVCSGFVSMFANIKCFENKPLSNYLNKIRVKILYNKNLRLQAKKEKDQAMLDLERRI